MYNLHIAYDNVAYIAYFVMFFMKNLPKANALFGGGYALVKHNVNLYTMSQLVKYSSTRKKAKNKKVYTDHCLSFYTQ